MSKYRNSLPQSDSGYFLTDGGLETTLIFHQGIDLPCFAAFDLLKNTKGEQTLRDYYLRYVDIARQRQCGFVLESPTWRANPDWATAIGYDSKALADFNRRAIELMQEIRVEYESPHTPIVISGNIGPRGDGYTPTARMHVEQAQDYHAEQIGTFAQSDADLITAVTLNYVDEAVGVVNAANDVAMPVVISFTVETDGRLPDGTPLGEAILQTDQHTNNYATYFMINCAHPDHFKQVLKAGTPWTERIHGLRANASRCSHAELDESPELDAGNPQELGQDYKALTALLPNLKVLGGCCGTDHRHVQSIASAVM